jgi:hypothetical protein
VKSLPHREPFDRAVKHSRVIVDRTSAAVNACQRMPTLEEGGTVVIASEVRTDNDPRSGNLAQLLSLA